MIDITVDGIDRTIKIEGKDFSFNSADAIVKAIYTILNAAKYSGESIILYDVINEKEKKLIQEWYK